MEKGSSGPGLSCSDPANHPAAAPVAAAAAAGDAPPDITALLLSCVAPTTTPKAAEALLDGLMAIDPSGEAAAAAVSVKDPAGMTPLLAAARRQGWAPVVRRMLAVGADVWACLHSSGNTAVHLAAAAGQVDILRELLLTPPCQVQTSSSNSLVNARNVNDDTPLMFACGGDGPRQVAAVALLLQRGADPCAANSEGLTPAMIAAGRGHELVLTALERHWQQQAGAGAMPLSGSHPLCARNVQGNGALAFACRAGQSGCVRLLLSKPAVARQAFERNVAGRTPKEEARHAGHLETARLLEDYERKTTAERERLAAELVAGEVGPSTGHKQQQGKQPPKRQPEQQRQRRDSGQQQNDLAGEQQQPEQEQEQQQEGLEVETASPHAPTPDSSASSPATASTPHAQGDWVLVEGRKGPRPSAAAAAAAAPVPSMELAAQKPPPPAGDVGTSIKAMQAGSGTSSGSGSRQMVSGSGWAAVVRGTSSGAIDRSTAASPSQQPHQRHPQQSNSIQQQAISPAQRHQQHPPRHLPWLEAAERALAELCPAASDLDLQLQHVLGLELDDLSPSQLEALEAVHRGALVRVAEARLRLAERQVEARLAEEAARRREIAAMAAVMGGGRNTTT